MGKPILQGKWKSIINKQVLKLTLLSYSLYALNSKLFIFLMPLLIVLTPIWLLLNQSQSKSRIGNDWHIKRGSLLDVLLSSYWIFWLDTDYFFVWSILGICTLDISRNLPSLVFVMSTGNVKYFLQLWPLNNKSSIFILSCSFYCLTPKYDVISRHIIRLLEFGFGDSPLLCFLRILVFLSTIFRD